MAGVARPHPINDREIINGQESGEENGEEGDKEGVQEDGEEGDKEGDEEDDEACSARFLGQRVGVAG